MAVALAGVLEEAEFYNIASLVRLVKERIRDNENRTSQVHSRLGLLFMLLYQHWCDFYAMGFYGIRVVSII